MCLVRVLGVHGQVETLNRVRAILMATSATQASKLEGQAYGLSGEGKPIETVEIPDLPNGGGTNGT